MANRTFSPGFRISLLDMVVIVIGTIATVALAAQMWWWGCIVGFVLAHFFLFCNAFRMARSLELAWAGIFAGLAGGTIVQDMPSWGITASISLTVTAVVVVIEMRKPSYHGICWQKINPNLQSWWQARMIETGRSTPPPEESQSVPISGDQCS